MLSLKKLRKSMFCGVDIKKKEWLVKGESLIRAPYLVDIKVYSSYFPPIILEWINTDTNSTSLNLIEFEKRYKKTYK